MSINLNDSSFDNEIKIFNDGEAGLVKNVKLRVEKKQPSDADNAPDYKLFAIDEAGAEVNEGFYYFKEQDNKDNERLKGYLLSRLVHIARAVMGKKYELPKVEDIHEAMDVVFKLVKKNAGENLFNVYVTYGTKDYPSKYLGLRFFSFIESADNKVSKLRPNKNDLLERIDPDQVDTSEDLEDLEELEDDDWTS